MNDGLLERYRRDGYVAIEGLVSPRDVAALREEAARLCLEKGKALGGGSLTTSSDPLGDTLAIHFPHKLSGRFRDALAHPQIVEALTALIGPNVKCMQSMLFIKRSGKPGQAWHQDEDFIPTRDSLPDRGLDRSRRRGGRQRLLMGDSRLAPIRRPLAAASPFQSRI